MRLVEYGPEYETAYGTFLARLGAPGGVRFPFAYYSKLPSIQVRLHLLVDDGTGPVSVVGAVFVKLQDYVVAGARKQVAVVTYPVSLGLVEPRYAMVAMLLFRRIAETYPLNFLLGMGPPTTNVTSKLCALLGWRVSPVPYLFLPRRLGPLAAKQLERFPRLAALLRSAGRLGIFSPVEAVMAARAAGGPRRLRVTRVSAFGPDLDKWWSRWSAEIGFSLVRDRAQMNAMYPDRLDAFEKLLFYDGEEVAGFAVLLVPDPAEVTRRMGVNLVTLVEFSLLKADLDAGARALAMHLFDSRLDAVIANTPHTATVAALEAHGFRPRTTHMYLAVSKALQSLLDEAGVGLEDMVVTRGDGDGPIGLGVDL